MVLAPVAGQVIRPPQCTVLHNKRWPRNSLHRVCLNTAHGSAKRLRGEYVRGLQQQDVWLSGRIRNPYLHEKVAGLSYLRQGYSKGAVGIGLGLSKTSRAVAKTTVSRTAGIGQLVPLILGYEGGVRVRGLVGLDRSRRILHPLHMVLGVDEEAEPSRRQRASDLGLRSRWTL